MLDVIVVSGVEGDCDGDDSEGVDDGRRDRTDQVGFAKTVLRSESGVLVASEAGFCDGPGDCDMQRRHMYDIGPAAVVLLKRKTLGAPLASTRLGCMFFFVVVEPALLVVHDSWVLYVL